jgi:hypothetical protein
VQLAAQGLEQFAKGYLVALARSLDQLPFVFLEHDR